MKTGSLVDAMLSRCSVGTKYLTHPAPSDEDVRLMVQAALRAPDHGGLVPFRCVAIRDAAKERLADLFEQAARAAGKPADEATRDRLRATEPPMLLAIVARIDAGHPLAPAHEQWVAVGGALTNLLNAAHALGYGAKMLSGAKVRAPAVVAALCEPTETLLGWVVLGTPTQAGKPKFGKPPLEQVLRQW
jgi:nitroreductase